MKKDEFEQDLFAKDEVKDRGEVIGISTSTKVLEGILYWGS